LISVNASYYFIYFQNEGDNPELPILPIEETYGRVVGGLRSTKGHKYILIYKFFPVTDLNELTAHMLEVIQIPIKLNKVKNAIVSFLKPNLNFSVTDFCIKMDKKNFALFK